MAAVVAPLTEVERVVDEIDGNVVIANINSDRQAVIGGATDAVQRAMTALTEAGHHVVQLPVSHAFHTSIVAPASEPLKVTATPSPVARHHGWLAAMTPSSPPAARPPRASGRVFTATRRPAAG